MRDVSQLFLRYDAHAARLQFDFHTRQGTPSSRCALCVEAHLSSVAGMQKVFDIVHEEEDVLSASADPVRAYCEWGLGLV